MKDELEVTKKQLHTTTNSNLKLVKKNTLLTTSIHKSAEEGEQLEEEMSKAKEQLNKLLVEARVEENVVINIQQLLGSFPLNSPLHLSLFHFLCKGMSKSAAVNFLFSTLMMLRLRTS